MVAWGNMVDHYDEIEYVSSHIGVLWANLDHLFPDDIEWNVKNVAIITSSMC